MILLENCANSIQSAIEAQKGGAARVELCDNLGEGGTTPSLSMIELTRKYIDIDLNIIIRPRGGDFLYSDIELESMKLDIEHSAKAGADGVVIGCLTKDGLVDYDKNAQLIEIAKKHDLNITFHRAIDRAKNLLEAMELIIKLGCDRILTSGGENTALKGKDKIKEMIEQARDKIIILPGAGITPENINELKLHTNLKEFHGSFSSVFNGKMEFKDLTRNLGTEQDEFNYKQTDRQKIKDAIANANK